MTQRAARFHSLGEKSGLGLRAMPEELRDEALLVGSQPGDPARGGMGAKGLGAVPLRDGKPVADGGVGDPESPGDRPLRPAFVLEPQRPHPPPLHPIPESRTRGLHTPFYGPEKLSSLRSDQYMPSRPEMDDP